MKSHPPPEPDAGWTSVDSALWIWLFLPVPLFLAGFLAPAAGLPLAALSLAGAACLLSPRHGTAASKPRVWIPLAMLAAAWTALGGAGHLFHANGIDWVPRFAVLRDLVVLPWPPRYEAEAGTQLLRAPVGYYLPPALAAKLLGLGAADCLLLAWTALGTALFLVAAFGNRGGLAAALLFAFASGLDALGLLLHAGQLPWPTQHIEWWAGTRQYSSNTTLLFWAPNHALPGWIATAWLWRLRDKPEFLARLPLLFLPLMLWSPLTALGFVPLALLALGLRWRTVMPRQFLAAAALASAPAAAIASYLLLGIAEPGATALTTTVAPPPPAHPAAGLPLFLAMEIGICALVLVRCRQPLVPVALVLLILLPLLPLGPNRDLVMRGSIPALALLWLLLAEQLTVPATNRRARRWQAAALTAFALGAVTPLQEMHRALAGHRWLPDLALGAPQALGGFAPHYFVRDVSRPWLPLRAAPSLPPQQ